MKISVITTGGTIDKIYFDAKSQFQVGESMLQELLRVANLAVEIDVQSVVRKDSLDLTAEDRAAICHAVRMAANTKVIVTHGTDTMIKTARALGTVPGKTVVFTGSLQPARFRESDALFNIGGAFAAVQTLPEGTYIVMNGCVFNPKTVKKNVTLNRFESK